MKTKQLLLSALLLLGINGYAQQAPVMPDLVNQYYTDVKSLDRVYIFRESPEYYDRLQKHNAETLPPCKSWTLTA
ncbi:hypothetical protein MKQ70_06530 [Chitinophaga sedimenti]|uniref:hypothetical protein n=1 Tax=Chitinophaga sedimenti TaxID=2033606 RepID=UPI002005DAE8|nr:hypothetical protein [Chitinophaga sedimenti]MCK7554675.1 hypothetical protein [Chitinophaga sedimenti]